jgi:hypothetical protein
VDFFVTALIINRSLAMFASALGTWIPFGLIFASTWLSGVLAAESHPGVVDPPVRGQEGHLPDSASIDEAGRPLSQRAHRDRAIPGVIDRVYPLEDVVKAARYVETEQKTGNVVFKVNSGRARRVITPRGKEVANVFFSMSETPAAPRIVWQAWRQADRQPLVSGPEPAGPFGPERAAFGGSNS